MSRLEKKCVLASAGLHLLLLVIIVVGPAFLLSRSKPADDLPVLTMIPDVLTDKPFSGGGNPDVKPPPPSATPPQPQPQAKAPPPEPPAPKPQPERVTPPPKRVEARAPEPIKTRPRSEVPDVVEKPRRRLPDVPTDIVTRPSESTLRARQAAAEAARQAAVARAAGQALSREFSSAARSLQEGAVGTTSIELRGPGGGGPAYANYAQVVQSIYVQAWLVPANVVDDTLTTVATIIISRDGTVISARIKQHSGNAAMDASVEQTLNRVKFIAKFPEGATDETRTYELEFNLKAKRALG